VTPFVKLLNANPSLEYALPIEGISLWRKNPGSTSVWEPTIIGKAY
jgi:hypothetical protein